MIIGEKKKRFNIALVLSLCFWLFAHGYRFFNNYYTHDALMEIFQDDIFFQRSLGRFLQPVFIILRGSVCAPWLIGIISLAFLALSAFFVIELLELNNIFFIVSVVGLMVCNNIFTVANVAFLPWVDIFAASLFFSVLAVCFANKDTLKGYFAGGFFLFLSLGLYQAYAGVTLMLILIMLLKELRNGKDVKSTVVKGLKNCGMLVTSGALYWGMYRLVCIIHHVELSGSYNSLENFTAFENISIIDLILGTYKHFFVSLFNTATYVSTYIAGIKISYAYSRMLFIVTLLLMALGIVCMVLINVKRKSSVAAVCLQIFGIIMLPLMADFIYIAAKGMVHSLMVFSFLLTYIMIIGLVDETLLLYEVSPKINRYVSVTAFVLMIAMVWNNIVVSNQAYYKIDLQMEAFESFTTRLVGDIERQDDYEFGKTPVCFVGEFEKSEYIGEVPYIREITMQGVGKTPITYMDTFYSYLTNVQNININIVKYDGDKSYEIDKMPIYPTNGSIKSLDGILYVKYLNKIVKGLGGSAKPPFFVEKNRVLIYTI